MNTIVTLNSKNQIVIPREIREALKLNSGHKLMLKIEGEHLIIMPMPDDPIRALRGRHKEAWYEVNTEQHIYEERLSWDD